MTQEAESSTKPLDGIRVLDLTANVAGPLCCQVLCDLGADVVKIEPPQGEAGRRITATTQGAEHVTPYFSPNNRGKKSVRVELASEQGRRVLRSLISEADVFVQSTRPGTMERHGFGPADVASLNPTCIYVALSAFGGGSELGDRPGIDMIVQAEAGCLSGQPRHEAPRLIPFQLVDAATGHVVAQSVLAAILHRERFGVVNTVEVSMYDVACSLQANHLTLQLNTPPAKPAEKRDSRRSVAVEPSGVYRTGDGYIVLAAYVPRHWAKLVEVLDREELAADERFKDQALRSRNAGELREVITDALSTHGAEEWVELLQAAGLMASRVATWRDVVTSEIFALRGLSIPARQGEHEVSVVRTPALFSSFDTSSARDIPELGEHEQMLVPQNLL